MNDILYSEMAEGEVSWGLPGLILANDVTGIVGEEKAGKGLWSCDYAARVSRGWPNPPFDPLDPTAPEGDTPGQVIMISPEDEVDEAESDVVIHRLKAAGADLSKIDNMSIVNRGKIAGNTVQDSFSLPQDIPLLRQRIDDLGDVRLVIIDPLLSTATSTIAFNQQLRMKILAPLRRLAKEKGLQIIVIHHFNKGVTIENMLDRVNGSKGFLQTLRVTNAIIRHPLDPDTRLMLNLTNQFSNEGTGLEFTIGGDSPSDSHVRYRVPPPQVTPENMDRLQANILAMLIQASRPVSSQEVASYTRLSHGLVRQLLKKSEIEGAVEKSRGAYTIRAIEAPVEEAHDKVTESWRSASA